MEGNEKSKVDDTPSKSELFNKGFLNKGFLNKSVGNVKDVNGVPGVQNDKIDVSATTPVSVNAAASLNEDKIDGSHEKPKSYAATLQNVKQARKVNFRSLSVDNSVEGADLTIPLANVEEVNSRFANTLYGYFLGNRLAFPIVENYVKNTWAKFGIRKVMMNSAGFFFFKFETKAGMEQVMERGPWLIRSVPILLNFWTPNTSLTKQDITSIPVWVKLYDVPLVAYTEDGLSMLATKLGIPIMLDSYTSDMCLDSWGRNSYARALIQINSDKELRTKLVVAIPSLTGEDYTIQTVAVEYEWKPPRCSTCKVFGHSNNMCSQNLIQEKVVQKDTNMIDGFTAVGRKGGKGKQVDGIRLTKPKPNFVYRPKHLRDPKEASTSTAGKTPTSNVAGKDKEVPVSQSGPKVALKNSFDVLKSATDDHVNASTSSFGVSTPQVVDSDDDEVVYDETTNFIAQHTKAADIGEAMKNIEKLSKIEEKEGNICGGGSSLYSQFKQFDYSDDDEDDVYDVDENEIHEIQRAFCKTMDTTLKGRTRK